MTDAYCDCYNIKDKTTLDNAVTFDIAAEQMYLYCDKMRMCSMCTILLTGGASSFGNSRHSAGDILWL